MNAEGHNIITVKYSVKFSPSIQRKLHILLTDLKQILLIYINNMKRGSRIHQFLQPDFTTVTQIQPHGVTQPVSMRQTLKFIYRYFSTLAYLLQIAA